MSHVFTILRYILTCPHPLCLSVSRPLAHPQLHKAQGYKVYKRPAGRRVEKIGEWVHMVAYAMPARAGGIQTQVCSRTRLSPNTSRPARARPSQPPICLYMVSCVSQKLTSANIDQNSAALTWSSLTSRSSIPRSASRSYSDNVSLRELSEPPAEVMELRRLRKEESAASTSSQPCKTGMPTGIAWVSGPGLGTTAEYAWCSPIPGADGIRTMFCTSAASVVQNSALTGQLSSSRVDLFLLHSGDGRRALGDPRIMIGISTCET